MENEAKILRSRKLGKISKIVAIIYICYLPFLVAMYLISPSMYSFGDGFGRTADLISALARKVLGNGIVPLLAMGLSIVTIVLAQTKQDKKRGIFLLTIIILIFLISFGGLILFLYALGNSQNL